MEGSGKVVLRKDIVSSPETLLTAIKPYLPHCLVGLEASSTTNWLFHGLQKAGVNVVCMETHHARKALSSQPVKNDRNDAEGLAQLLRTGWYKSVHVKQEDTQELKCWIEAREMLKHKQQDIKNAIRGLVKPFGITLPGGTEYQWIEAVKKRLAHERTGLLQVIMPLLTVYETICNELAAYTRFVEKVAKEDEVCKRLQTIDGIGPVNAVAFKAIIEQPERFDSNRDVGAYLGMTPRIYASGETERRGRISRAGSEIMRSLLFEAAQILLVRVKRMSCLKSWGLRLCKRKPTKLVIAALARKLAVLMLAVWKNGTTFQPTREKLSLAMAG
jgi:transposase